MASAPRKELTQGVVLAWIALSVLLIGLIWADNLAGPQPGEGGFIRGTPVRLATIAPTLTPTPLAISPTSTGELSSDD